MRINRSREEQKVGEHLRFNTAEFRDEPSSALTFSTEVDLTETSKGVGVRRWVTLSF